MEVLRHADVDPLADARDLIVRHEAEHVCHVASFDAERSERLDEGVDRSPPVGDHLPRFQPGYVDVRYPGRSCYLVEGYAVLQHQRLELHDYGHGLLSMAGLADPGSTSRSFRDYFISLLSAKHYIY